MRRFLVFTALVCLLFSTSKASPPQEASNKQDLKKLIKYTAELEMQAQLAEFVYDLYLQDGEGRIADEQYLISLMHLMSREMSKRLKNPKQARKQYFGELHHMLEEIQQLSRRLHSANIRDLDSFVDDLNLRIKTTIDQGEVDFRKKKVYEDALQMLFVSEEMIKLDQVQSPADIRDQISQSKQKLLNAFGENTSGDIGITGREPNIYDLFVEWKKTREVKFSRQLADVRLARKNLLKASGLEAVQRMFNEQLKLAYTRFNYEDYDLAEKLLGDLIEDYTPWGIKNIDDVYFYRAECNFALDRLMHAEANYQELIRLYPATSYLPDAYSRLVQIHYSTGSYREAIDAAGQYQNFANLSSPDYYDIQFLLAMSYYALGNYDRTVETLLNVPGNHPFYHLAQYFIGNAYMDSQLFDDAVTCYVRLVGSKDTPPYLHARSLYKLGVLEYERKNFPRAVFYLNEIDPAFSRYDKVLNALAWSYFEQERSKAIGQKRDFSQAQFYAKRLIDEYYASPYRMEATGLLAYINQFENAPVEAISLYREVYQEKVKRSSIQAYIDERNRLETLYRDARQMQENAMKTGNAEAYAKATSLMGELNTEITEMDLSESSSSGLSVYREAASLIQQIKELNALRLLAEESDNPYAVARIDSLQWRLAAVLETLPEEVFKTDTRVNFFDDYPVSKYVTEEEARYQNMQDKKMQVLNEMSHIDDMVKDTENRIMRASRGQNYEAASKLEQQQRHLAQLKQRYDQLLTAIHQADANPSPYPEFNRWGDLGAFGIINVYFDQKQQAQGQLVKVSEVFDRVNKQLNHRKEVIEDKIRKIESEVRFMTMKARTEERARLRAERERAFRESYFDTRESETPEEEQQQ